MNAVRQATDAMGLITVATIHQPSKRIFDAFDDVLLLTKGGKMTYMGESASLLDHFNNLSQEPAPQHCNPSDFCLSVLDKSVPDDAKAAFDISALKVVLDKNIENEVEKGKSYAPPTVGVERSVNCLTEEIWLLTKRHTIVQWRNPSYCLMRMILSSILSFFLGILFFGDKSQLQGAIFSIGAIFFLVFVLVLPMQAAVVPLIEDRAVSLSSAHQCRVLLLPLPYPLLTNCLGALPRDSQRMLLSHFIWYWTAPCGPTVPPSQYCFNVCLFLFLGWV